jgi:hypothetical protein
MDVFVGIWLGDFQVASSCWLCSFDLWVYQGLIVGHFCLMEWLLRQSFWVMGQPVMKSKCLYPIVTENWKNKM